jgi:hypothetical protein
LRATGASEHVEDHGVEGREHTSHDLVAGAASCQLVRKVERYDPDLPDV